jgi:hypothetical protein
MNTRCANCETPLKGSYCYECGQTSRGTDKFFLTLINEAFEDIFSMNSRVWKTLGNLIGRPGFLSTEYFAGRRVRYIPPIRLYFTLSILFFITYALASFFSPESSIIQIDDTALEQKTDDKPKPDLNDIVREVIKEAKTERAKELASQGKEPEPDDEPVRIDLDEPVRIDLTGEDGANIPWLSDEQSAALEKRFEAQVKKANDLYKVNPDAAGEYFREVAPPLIFCLLPLFALLLKLFYAFKKMYYTQHLVLAVHNHCFVFLWLTTVTIIEWIGTSLGGTPDIIQFVIYAWCPYYLWRSLRVVYQQGKLATTFKFSLLAISYFFLMMTAFGGATIVGILTV